MLTEDEWRQRELNKKIDKLNKGYYNTYYFEDNLIVFVKHMKNRDKKNCCNIVGLNLDKLNIH